jgi:hypothetical protein
LLRPTRDNRDALQTRVATENAPAIHHESLCEKVLGELPAVGEDLRLELRLRWIVPIAA